MTPDQRIHQHETAIRALTSHTAQQTAQLAQFCNYMASPHPSTTRGDIASEKAELEQLRRLARDRGLPVPEDRR